MWPFVVGLVVVVVVQFLAILVQRSALFGMRRSVIAYREEIERANQLMAVMAREDIAAKSTDEKARERRPLPS